MHASPNETLGNIVAADYRAAAVLERFGMDYCCGGRQTLSEACRDRAVELNELLEALDGLPAGETAGVQPAEWPLDALVDHIVSTHHEYVKTTIPVLAARTAKIAAVHGELSPELPEVARHFAEVAEGMVLHMHKEEHLLFPYVRALVAADRTGRRIGGSPFGTVENPIRMMEVEHQDAGDEMRMIRELTHDYAVPDHACATYRACLAELEAFERDLHRHVHLENNILFPGAVALERRLLRL
jgi:regulator of cell morphogenesis and NO signaling